MPVLSTSGVDVPNDFPASQFEAVHTKLVAYGQRSEYGLIVGALHAIAFRFRALSGYDENFTASINNHGPGPGQPFRYEQERGLFGFFSNAFSVFEAFCFALFAIGALTGSGRFPLATEDDERNVTWNSMQQAYGGAFPGNPILDELRAIADDAALRSFETSEIS